MMRLTLCSRAVPFGSLQGIGRLGATFVSLIALFALAMPAAAKDGTILVLTELPPLYSITASLTAGTQIEVKNVPADGRRMNALGRYLEKPGAASLALFKDADAVVTIGKLWHDSALYASVRAQNIRVVNIDATEPYSTTMPGVALVRELPSSPPWEGSRAREAPAQPTSVYCWLSPSNGVRMAEIIAQDLMRLAPQESERVAQNLLAYRRALLGLKTEYEAKFAGLQDLSLFSLSGDFAYLVADMGLYAEGSFIKQDIDWTPQDVTHLRDYLRKQRIAVVVHKWEPSAAILGAIREAGAVLAVLKTGEDGIVRDGALSVTGYVEELRADLETLYRAGLSAAK